MTSRSVERKAGGGSAHEVVQVMLCPLPAPCCTGLDIQSLGRKTIV